MWTLWWGEAMGKAKQVSLCAIFIALALALSYTERFIPLQLVIPLPGIKLGLANIVTLVALALFKNRYTFAIVAIRCILGAVFGGGITGLIFSLSGGLLALCVMAAVRKVGVFSLYGISILGAAAHNAGQILAAMAVMESVYIGGYLPYLLLVSIVTGLLTGSICAGILRILPQAHISIPGQMRRAEA